MARSWVDLPSVALGEIAYPITPGDSLRFRIGLRRDLGSWQEDPLGLNFPLSYRELDLNEPTLGYYRSVSPHFDFAVGRMPMHWSPSDEFGLALSRAVPFHNGASLTMKLPRFRYRFLVSSLNPWLQGTPEGNTSNADYPVGSEEYRQRNYPTGRAAAIYHHRIYDARIKTLFAHRIEADLGPLSLGMTEIQIIGGKVPDLRDAGPFILFHNDFKEGFSNGAVSLDAAMALPYGFRLCAEFYMDDVQFKETEGEGNTASILGYLAGIRHRGNWVGWAVMQNFHAIRTDPFLYGYLQPLNTMASRHVLASNRSIPGDSILRDRYVVDYPIGYLRGGDAFDFWYRLAAVRGDWRIGFAAAALARGPIGLSTPYETYYRSAHDSPTGIAEREIRLSADAAYAWRSGLSFRGGAAWQAIENEGNEQGEDTDRFQLGAGMAWAWAGGSR